MKAASRWSTPHGMMAIVFAMYLCKVVAKLVIGYSIHSPMITGDGWHNVADLLEVVMVIVAVRMARRPADEDYPFGRKNVESIARAMIGVGLLLAALRFVGASVAGLLSYAPELDRAVRGVVPFLPHHHPLQMGNGIAPWVISLTAISVGLSYVVSRHEIRVGKAHGHPSMVADGEETRSDGLIESAILVGICAEYLLRAPWLEYIFGLGVAALISRTGLELFLGGWRALLQKSLGREVETALKEECGKTHGVAAVEQITTFTVGSLAVCIIKILTDAPASAHDDIKKALKERLAKRLVALGHEDSTFHLRFSRTPLRWQRVAYAIVSDGEAHAVATDLEEATHFAVCNLERGVAVRWWLEKLPSACQGDCVSWLEEKRVEKLYFFADGQPVRHGSVVFEGVPTYNLRTLGLLDH